MGIATIKATTAASTRRHMNAATKNQMNTKARVYMVRNRSIQCHHFDGAYSLSPILRLLLFFAFTTLPLNRIPSSAIRVHNHTCCIKSLVALHRELRHSLTSDNLVETFFSVSA